MSIKFKKKYKNEIYPSIKFYSNMILSDKQLKIFIYKNNKISLVNRIKNKIDIDKRFRNYLDNKINNILYKIINRNISLEKTFNYLFYNTLSGIYVKILNNKLKIFYLFYNENYKNDWLNNIKFNNYYKNLKEKILLRIKVNGLLIIVL